MTSKASQNPPKAGQKRASAREAPKGDAAEGHAASGEAPRETEVARFLKDWTALWREELRVQAHEMEAAPFAGMPAGAEGMLQACLMAMASWARASLVPPSALIPPGLVPSGDGSGASRAKAAAAASDPRDAAIQRLIRRVDELDARLAKLEAPRRGRG